MVAKSLLVGKPDEVGDKQGQHQQQSMRMADYSNKQGDEEFLVRRSEFLGEGLLIFF